MAAQKLQDEAAFRCLAQLQRNIQSVFFGKPETVGHLLVGLISRGHILIEDRPGVGKTVLARALAKSIDCSFSRIQLTPDLLPSDILGVSIYDQQTSKFEFKHGPIFAHVVLADEINRTTPRTQSALLEAMNEAQVSMDGLTMPLAKPFVVIATQNPFDIEGTFLLPENQLDRFAIRLRIGYPDRDVEQRIVRERPDRTHLQNLQPVMNAGDILALQDWAAHVRVDDRLMNYTLDIVEATRKHQLLEVGVSPRGTQALIRAAQALALLHDRTYVIPDDIKSLAVPVCAHRLVNKSFMHNGHAAASDQIMTEIVEQTAVPG
jgi:MoxR-like ATPase